MADILSFKNAQRRPSSARPLDAGEASSAEILFFTGVRYERQDMDAVKTPRKPVISGQTDAAIGS
jgi:hypothetical protein